MVDRSDLQPSAGRCAGSAARQQILAFYKGTNRTLIQELRSAGTLGTVAIPATAAGGARRAGAAGDRPRPGRGGRSRSSRRLAARRRSGPGPAAGSACGSETSTVKASGSRPSSCREAAGLAPHPVRDRPREAERPGGQRVQVDRVAVARDGGVAAAEVARQPPLGAEPGTSSPTGAEPSPRSAVRVAAAAAEDRPGLLPDQLAVRRGRWRAARTPGPSGAVAARRRGPRGRAARRARSAGAG